ncbi:hypothetical protein B9Z55_013267 [Caenorhabditis nigoni]|uniref:Uncharacterized protein n=1 Tax=Caenorhabditis nigoni TaxID=1611254 RepID=A0A2G5U0Y6_9PELO|nr:hypothetical protein B9Z55_013267 [Caenorhabditis nigoni]
MPRRPANRFNVTNPVKPSEFMQMCCFDETTGELLPRDICDKNLENAMKSVEEIDYLDILNYENTPLTAAISMTLYNLNETLKADRKREKEAVAAARRVAPRYASEFDLKAAQEVDQEGFLPGDKRISLSMLINPSMCAQWTGKMTITNAVISILKEIQSRDPYFFIYSAPVTNKKTTYPTIPNEFFCTFAHVLTTGFGLADSSQELIQLIGKIRGVTRNFIDKQRRHADGLGELLDKFQENYKRNPSFRAAEAPVQDSPIITAAKVDFKPRAIKREIIKTEADPEETQAPRKSARQANRAAKY